jgi:hypothetical protein
MENSAAAFHILEPAHQQMALPMLAGLSLSSSDHLRRSVVRFAFACDYETVTCALLCPVLNVDSHCPVLGIGMMHNR